MPINSVTQIPGGVEAQIDSVNSILEHVDSESPFQSDLEEWMVAERFGRMESEESAGRVIRFLLSLGVLDKEGEQLQVGPRGSEWLTGSTGDRLGILEDTAIGFQTLLEGLKIGDCTRDELLDHLNREFEDLDWETDTQVELRLNFLRSLDLVEYEDGTHSLTEEGDDLAEGKIAERFRPPPTVDEFLDELEDDPDFPIYLAVQPRSAFDDRYIRVPLDTETGVEPRHLDPEAVIFHCIDGDICGVSRQREPGWDDSSGGDNHRQIPVELNEFGSPLPIYEVLGELVDPDVRLEADRYPFDSTGLRDIDLGEIGADAARPILEAVSEPGTYADAVDEVPLEDENLPDEADIDDLYYPGGDLSEIVGQIGHALQNRKHVILVGPPGTGKSELAEQVTSEVLDDDGSDSTGYSMVTATADWSTFDTIGGYQPGGDAGLEFVSGVFLDRFQDADGLPKNEWLIVDELNRADIDKAFGPLFSALVGDSVKTTFKDDAGRAIEIRNKEQAASDAVESSVYCVPDSWRMLATMNTHDKMSLYDLSYAFMRRFAFVHVGAPSADDISPDEIEEYVDRWDIETGADGGLTDEQIAHIATFWQTIQPHRKLGPALIEEIATALTADGVDFTRPMKMYVIPQLEDLPPDTQEDAVNAILGLDDFPIASEELVDFAGDYLGLDEDRLGEADT